ncbi:MAG: hypothetical protein QNJ47_04050 [Nostocaceae cyanobacterium]|nr:hypothetical protein [Nostocaceae cyanobacterium]
MLFKRVEILTQLGTLIEEKRLTDVLKALEILGACCDRSVALLAYLQQGGEP